jgi:predicted outer membrane protein
MLTLIKQPDADTPYAEKMISDHRKTSSEVKALVSNGKVKATLPESTGVVMRKRATLLPIGRRAYKR